MTTTDTGRKAEAAVAQYLKAEGHTILDQNWRTRWCEIDIVSQKSGVIYFVEVKYRATVSHGDGLQYITPKKLDQMAFAAEFWVANHHWPGEYCLVAAAVSGSEFSIDAVIEL